MTSDPSSQSATPNAFAFLQSILPNIPPELQPAVVLGYDIDAFERDANLFAAQLGLPVEDLLEIAKEARSGSDPLAKKRAKQHVVTRALLAGWCTGTSRDKGDQLIWSYSLATGPEPLIDPTFVGIVPDFIKVDSERTEMAWELIETTIRDVVARLETSPNLNDPGFVEKVKKIVALHWARSIETLEAVEHTWAEGVGNTKQWLTDHPDVVDDRYRQASGDPNAVLSESARKDFVEMHTKRAEWVFTSGTWFRFDVIYFLRRAQEEWADFKVQVLRAPAGSEFLIGDTPVVKMDGNGERRGSEHPIAVGEAASVLLPFSPKIAVVLDNLPRDVEITAAAVRRYNEWQLRAARERVFMHPSASSLMAWVEKTRPPTAT